MAEPEEDARQKALKAAGQVLKAHFGEALEGPIGDALLAALNAEKCSADSEAVFKAPLERCIRDAIQGGVADAVEKALSDADDRRAAAACDSELIAAVECALSDAACEGLAISSEVFVIEVVAPNRAGLLAGVLQVLASNRVGVRTARGATWRGSAAWLSIEVEARIDRSEWARLWEHLTRASGGTVTLWARTKVAGPLKTVCLGMPGQAESPEVTVTNKPGGRHTTLTVLAIDRLGLLAVVAGVIVRRGYDFIAVDAQTQGAEANDVFDIIDQTGHQLSDKAARELEEALLHALAPAA